MKIELHKIPERKVIAGYKDSAEEGVVAYNLLPSVPTGIVPQMAQCGKYKKRSRFLFTRLMLRQIYP